MATRDRVSCVEDKALVTDPLIALANQGGDHGTMDNGAPASFKISHPSLPLAVSAVIRALDQGLA